MNKLLIAILLTGSLAAQSAVETSVLTGVQEMLQEEGRITFSELHNDPRFSPEQKAFLGRLYEIFFAIPGYLKSEFERDQTVPTRAAIASQFGVSTPSIDLLLAVMEADRRVPPLYERDPATRELVSIKLANINAFIAARGDQVRVTGWEGRRLPEFEVRTYEGKPVSSQGLKGRNALVYFWFTNCPPCVRIAPILKTLHGKYAGENFTIVGLNADEVLDIGTTNDQRIAAARQKGTPYPNANVTPEARKAFGSIQVFPTLFFVNREGEIVKHFVNFQDQETLEGVIRELLK